MCRIAHRCVARGGGDLELAPQEFQGYCHFDDEYQKKSSQLLKTKAGLLEQKSRNDRFGFTLAEVLITLGIIGVVAAMTMPTLIANYQKKQTIVQLKKAYSVLNQAYQNSILDNGDVETWDWENISNADNFGQRYILPYLKGVNKITRSQITWMSLDGKRDSSPSYFLSDGMSFRFNGLNFVNNPANRAKTHLKINIDINGNKLPNQYGRDVFVFSIFPFASQSKGKVVPGTNDQCGGGAIHNQLSREQLLTGGCATCKTDHTGYGYGCAAVIIKDGWEIKDDYPW